MKKKSKVFGWDLRSVFQKEAANMNVQSKFLSLNQRNFTWALWFFFLIYIGKEKSVGAPY